MLRVTLYNGSEILWNPIAFIRSGVFAAFCSNNKPSRPVGGYDFDDSVSLQTWSRVRAPSLLLHPSSPTLCLPPTTSCSRLHFGTLLGAGRNRKLKTGIRFLCKSFNDSTCTLNFSGIEAVRPHVRQNVSGNCRRRN